MTAIDTSKIPIIDYTPAGNRADSSPRESSSTFDSFVGDQGDRGDIRATDESYHPARTEEELRHTAENSSVSDENRGDFNTRSDAERTVDDYRLNLDSRHFETRGSGFSLRSFDETNLVLSAIETPFRTDLLQGQSPTAEFSNASEPAGTNTPPDHQSSRPSLPGPIGDYGTPSTRPGLGFGQGTAVFRGESRTSEPTFRPLQGFTRVQRGRGLATSEQARQTNGAQEQRRRSVLAALQSRPSGSEFSVAVFVVEEGIRIVNRVQNLSQERQSELRKRLEGLLAEFGLSEMRLEFVGRDRIRDESEVS